MLVKLVDTTVTKLGAGVVEDNLLTTENALVLIKFLADKSYFLGIAADRKTAKLGNMRLISRIFAERVTKAMPH
jgi:predicted regulator of Ras-like GTPase activity (Roadblock/LC7/MglB family)